MTQPFATATSTAASTAVTTATGTSDTPPPGSPHNPRAPLVTVSMMVDDWDRPGSGGITQIQKPRPGANTSPRMPAFGGAWAARLAPRQRQRSVNLNVDVADCSQLLAGRFGRFNATHAFLSVYAGIVTLPPGPPLVVEREFALGGGNRGLALSTTVSQVLGSPMAGFANSWTVWLHVNGLFQARVDLPPERKTLLVRCALPLTIG